jgi:hypothetical protein
MIAASLEAKFRERGIDLAPYKKERLNDILAYLGSESSVNGVLLGGSIAYKANIEKADIDLFCLTTKVELFESTICEALRQLQCVDMVICQGYFPWTEELYTIYYRGDYDFSIDLCLVDTRDVESFFWEPDGYILWDNNELISNSRAFQMSELSYTRQPFLKKNPFSLAIVTLKKIEKNLSRNHLWNALEQLNITRRYVMQLIRWYIIHDRRFLGRVDRDVEDVIASNFNVQLAETIADYDKSDIARKSMHLINILESIMPSIDESREPTIKDWASRQLEHEATKLKTYVN